MESMSHRFFSIRSCILSDGCRSPCDSELQGHAIKNQDLLIASGTISSKGSEGMSAVDDDMEAAVSLCSCPCSTSWIVQIFSCFIGFQHLSQTSTLIEDVTPDLRMRDRELTEIAKSIADLAELFKDLSVLVIDQGTLLDSVEYNIEQTSVQVAEAVKELDIATRYV